MDDGEAICLVISQVLVADGIMQPAERDLLERLMDSLGLPDEQRARVVNLEGLDEADAVVAALPFERRRDIVDHLLEAALVDGKLSPHETEAVRRLSERLGL